MWWHAQKPDFVFRRNERVHLDRRGRQFRRLLAAEVCTSAVEVLDKPYSEVVWRVLATHSFRQFPLYFPSRASPCAITFQLYSTRKCVTSPKTWILRNSAVRTLRPVNKGKVTAQQTHRQNLLPLIMSTVVPVRYCIRFLTVISRRSVKFTVHSLHCI